MAVEKYKDPVTGEWIATRAPKSQGAPKIHASQHAIDGTDPLTPEMIGATSMELLWENASPTSEFAAQEVLVDLSEYKMAMVVLKSDNTSSTYIHSLTLVGGSGYGYYTQNYPYLRSYTSHIDRINFSSARYYKAYGSYDSTVNDVFLVPYQIYGIKGVS